MNSLIHWWIKILSRLEEMMECAKWRLAMGAKSLGYVSFRALSSPGPSHDGCPASFMMWALLLSAWDKDIYSLHAPIAIMFHLTTVPETPNQVTMTYTFRNCELMPTLPPMIKLTRNMIWLETLSSVAARQRRGRAGKAKTDEPDYLLVVAVVAQDENIKGFQ